jgi:hypothetical protein
MSICNILDVSVVYIDYDLSSHSIILLSKERIIADVQLEAIDDK